ncbi:MAG: hypothetical protein FJX78_03960 [Armatimonadetes bacterium]|nr:hypothetical protein [Armatimonadota bacterium]
MRSLFPRLASIVFGLFCFSFGIVVTLRSEVGLGPWYVLHQGLTRQFPLRFGEANIAVGLVILAVAWRFGQPPGPGTIMNMFLVGIFTDRILDAGLVPPLGEFPLTVRVAANLAGIFIVGLGSGLYIRARLGAGPRDSLMLAISRRTSRPVGVARSALEIVVFLVGVALGGQWGLGTLLFALGIGPSIQIALRILQVPHGVRFQPTAACTARRSA